MGRLLFSMTKLSYPTQIISFFRALLTECFTQLHFGNFLSELLVIDNGIGQGEYASMLLYLIYNHGLVSFHGVFSENGGAYIDDTFFMTVADNFDECDKILNRMLDKQEAWSHAHNSPAEISKFQCLCLTCKTTLERSDFLCSSPSSNQHIKCIQTATVALKRMQVLFFEDSLTTTAQMIKQCMRDI